MKFPLLKSMVGLVTRPIKETPASEGNHEIASVCLGRVDY